MTSYVFVYYSKTLISYKETGGHFPTLAAAWVTKAREYKETVFKVKTASLSFPSIHGIHSRKRRSGLPAVLKTSKN